jgi:outer membrane receptor for ferrienterochelin and colicins
MMAEVTFFARITLSSLGMTACLTVELLLGQPANAQEHPADAPPVEISVTAERDDPRRFESASKITIPTEELTKYNDASLLDAVKRLPGITVDGTEIRFRGLGTGYTQILIDGDPAPLDFTLDSLAPDVVERIEIYKTPTANLSAQSIAGTINIVLKKKTKNHHLSSKVGVAYNQGNKSPSVTLDGSENFEHFSYQVTGVASKNSVSQSSHIDEYDYDASHSIVTQRAISRAFDQETITYNVTPTLSWKNQKDSIHWQLLLQHFETPFLFDLNEQTLIGLPSDYPYGRSQSRDAKRDLYRSNLTWSHAFSEGSLESKINMSYQGRHSNFYFYGYDPSGEFALDRNIPSSTLTRNLVSKEEYVQQLSTDHSLAAGWDASITQRSDNRLQVDRAPPSEAIVYTLDQVYDARVVRKALYAQDDWTLSSALDTYLGMRYEMTNVRITGPDFTPASNNTGIFSPIAQLIWKMPYNSKDQVRVGIAHTTRAPSTGDLVPRRFTVNSDNGPANPDNQGNPNLKPERAWGIDVSYESYFHDGGLLSVSGYARHIDDVMVPILFTDGTEWVVSTVNGGTAKVYGTELEFKLPLQGILRSKSKLLLKGDVSANWSHVDNIPGPNNRLAEQTPFTANLALEYEPAGHLSGGASIRYTAEYTAKATTTLSDYFGATQSFDLYGVWTLSPTSRIKLSIENLLHRNEVSAALYADAVSASNRYSAGDEGDRLNLSFEIGI